MWLFVQVLGIFALLVINSKAAERLPPDVTPNHYLIELTVTEDNLKDGNFTGKVTVNIHVDNNTLTYFNIHAKLIELTDQVTLVGDDLENRETFDGEISTEGPDAINDFLTIKSTTTLPKGNYTLSISYKGILSPTDMMGFYQSTYVENEKTKYLASTQFEQMGARRAFPCFDEPAIKATFTVTITCSPDYFALSNADVENVEQDDLYKFIFKPTPLMSTYLLAFVVCQFTFYPGYPTNGTTPILSPIYARSGSDNLVALSLESGPKALNVISAYTGVDYGDNSPGKMTQVAIPDFPYGAMENWGLVTYRESNLLWDPDYSSAEDEQRIVADISHEVAHQWFGNIVTLHWWSDAFLNEGFATYFEYHATHEFRPEFELTTQFILEELHVVLLSDAVNTSLPLSHDVDDTDSAINAFGDISYNKGGSIIRMVQHFMGLENFKNGLNVYFGKGPIGYIDNLWSSFQDFTPTDGSQKLPDTLATVMENWVSKPGYPLLNVSLAEDEKSVIITQRRFLTSGDIEFTTWYVPVTYTTSKNTRNFQETKTQAWLLPGNSLTLPLDDADWIILNNQQVGYYRVFYKGALLERISKALNSENFGNIDEIARTQLVDDQINLAKAGIRNYSDVFSFLTFLKNDDSYYSWSAAFNGFDYLLKRTNDQEVRKNLTIYITENMGTLLRSVSSKAIKPKHMFSIKRSLVYTWACSLGDRNCIEDAKNLFLDYFQDSTKKPGPNLQYYVYCTALRHSNDSQAHFDFLYNGLYSKLATEQLTLLKTLGCINNSTIRIEYLMKTLTNEIRVQDVSYVFASVYSNNPESVDDVITFMSENHQGFKTRFGNNGKLISLIYTIADLLSTQEQIDKLQRMTNIESLDDEVKQAVTEAGEIAGQNLETIKIVENGLKEYFQKSINAGWKNSYSFVNIVLALTVYLLFNL